MPQRKTTARVRSSAKRKSATPAAPKQVLHCHPPDGHRGNPPTSFRGAAPSFALVAIMAIALYSFFSVVQAQSLMKKESPQCNGFVACTQLFFGNLWRTITGNPTTLSLAQTPLGQSQTQPQPQDANIIIEDGKEVAIDANPVASNGGSSSPMNDYSLILQPMGMENVIIGYPMKDSSDVNRYKLDVGGPIRGERLKISQRAEVNELSAAMSVGTELLCLGKTDITNSIIPTCLNNVEDFGPWKKVANTKDIQYAKGGVVVDKFVKMSNLWATKGATLQGTTIFSKTDTDPARVTLLSNENAANLDVQGSAQIKSNLNVDGITLLKGETTLGGTLQNDAKFVIGNGSGEADLGNQQNNVKLNIAGSLNAKSITMTERFLPPRMTTDQMKAINGPPEGLTIYNTSSDKHQYQVWNGNEWDTMGGAWKKDQTTKDISYIGGKVGIGVDKNLSSLTVKGGSQYGFGGPDLSASQSFDGKYTYVWRINDATLDGLSPGDSISVRSSDGTTGQGILAGIVTNGSVKGIGISPPLNNSFNFATNLSLTVKPALFRLVDSTSKTKLVVTADGNVGIGAASPDTNALLDMTSTTKGFLPPRMTTDQMKAINGPPEGLTIYNTSSDKHQYQVWNGSEWDTMGGVWKKDQTTKDISYVDGKVGIGVEIPQKTLDVNGTGKFNDVSSRLLWNGTSSVCLSSGGSVSINTCSNSDYTLDVDGVISFGGSNADLDQSRNQKIDLKYLSGGYSLVGRNYSGRGGEVDFIANRGEGSVGGFRFYDFSNGTDWPSYNSKLLLNIVPYRNGTEVIARIGINKTNPQYELDVGGDINVSNQLGLKDKKDHLALAKDRIGLDVAELFNTEEPVGVGDVLVVGNQERMLKKSSAAYQDGIVGVVSESPAILFEGSQLKVGSKEKRFSDPRKPPVALTGRVPVKVSLENGSIAVGDYLTTSNKPGVAMKATEPGMTLGVALEPYSGKGEEKVLVYLSIKEANNADALKKLEGKMEKLEKKLQKK